MAGVGELRPKLREAAEAALNEVEPDNPVYRAAQAKVIREITPRGNTEEHILDRLERIESALNRRLVFDPTVRSKSPKTKQYTINKFAADEDQARGFSERLDVDLGFKSYRLTERDGEWTLAGFGSELMAERIADLGHLMGISPLSLSN